MIPIVAIIGIVILDSVALLLGIDGVVLASSLAAIAGIAGYKAKGTKLPKIISKVALRDKRNG